MENQIAQLGLVARLVTWNDDDEGDGKIGASSVFLRSSAVGNLISFCEACMLVYLIGDGGSKLSKSIP
jgi:hypothetical protein